MVQPSPSSTTTAAGASPVASSLGYYSFDDVEASETARRRIRNARHGLLLPASEHGSSYAQFLISTSELHMKLSASRRAFSQSFSIGIKTFFLSVCQKGKYPNHGSIEATSNAYHRLFIAPAAELQYSTKSLYPGNSPLGPQTKSLSGL